MWLGEQITERGIGNGISLIIFAGIVAGMPDGVIEHLSARPTGEMGAHCRDPLLAVIMVAVVGIIVFMERASGASRSSTQSGSSAERCTAGRRRTCR